MTASVVGDQAIAAPQQGTRALHDVATSGRQTVQEHHRRPVPGDFAIQEQLAAVREGPHYLEGFGLHESYTVTRSFPLTREKHGCMALRDTWHRTLVYFGLAEEEDPRYETVRDPEPEAELEDRYRDRPNVRRLSSRRRGDDIDDIFADDPGDRRTNVLRAVGNQGARPANGRGDVRVHLVMPKSFNDAQDVADKFKDSIPVIINLQGTDTELSKRLIDFASGLTYALDGGMQRIADKVFLLTPRNVEVSAEERARLIEKGFFNQS